jgi:flagellar protein FliT
MKELPPSEILGSYEHLTQVTARMRAAAAQDDWESVIALESECAPVYARLMASREQGPVDEQYQRRKSELICKLLEDDAEIRERISGQLTHIWRLIHGRSRVEQLSSAYGGAGE